VRSLADPDGLALVGAPHPMAAVPA
jgi:hypothetical protein